MIEVFVDATRCLTIRDEANVDAIVIDSIQTYILILGKSQSSQGLSTAGAGQTVILEIRSNQSSFDKQTMGKLARFSA